MTRHPTSCRSCVPGALRALGLAALLAACACSGLQAQQLSLLGGTMETTDPTYSSYSWQVDYRQHITRNWAASVGPKKDEDPVVAIAERMAHLKTIGKTLGVF